MGSTNSFGFTSWLRIHCANTEQAECVSPAEDRPSSAFYLKIHAFRYLEAPKSNSSRSIASTMSVPFLEETVRLTLECYMKTRFID